MKMRGYIGILIVILTFLGVVDQQKFIAPNQEIVLQFAEGDFSYESAQLTISFFKQQLEFLGAENIQVKEQKNGQLTLTYFCLEDASAVKRMLSNDNEIHFAYASQLKSDPADGSSNQDSTPFNLDVFDLKKTNDVDWNLEGTLVLEIKSETVRFLIPYLSAPLLSNSEKHLSSVLRTAFNSCKVNTLALRNTFVSIPEVRAGPTT